MSDARERLSAREIAVLELLARGHTIKSAAQITGDSEGAANELLRSARAKLGVGSSREAARLIAADALPGREAQKNRHETSGIGEQALGPAAVSSSPSRRLVMIAILAIVSAAAAATLVGQASGERRPTAPSVIASSPTDGAKIKPGPFVLSVSFDRPMQRDSFSFATGPEKRFPRCDGRPVASRDGRIFTMRCFARAGDRYVVWANHGRFMNFRSVDGMAASPTRLAFAVAP